jgi:thiol-disulfide isomerase/thioredoxin
MLFKIFSLLFLPLSLFAQKDSTAVKTISTKAVKNIFRGPAEAELSPATYMELANSGLYTISSIGINYSMLEYRLDSGAFLKMGGKPIQLLLLADIYNKRYVLSRKHYTVVNFWSTTCKPCIEEIDSLNAIRNDFPGIEFIAITPDSVQQVKAFLERKKFSFRILFARENLLSQVHIDVYPTHFIVSTGGVLQWLHIGKGQHLGNNCKNFNECINPIFLLDDLSFVCPNSWKSFF